MFSNITQHISTTEYQGLEIFEVAGTFHYALLKLQRKQGELELSGAWSSTALEDIATHIDAKKPLFLQINTGRVLNKQLDGDRPALAEQWVKKAFPNLDLQQFNYQVIDNPKIKLVSITKRSVVKEHLAELKKLGFVPAGVSIGVAGLSPSLGFMQPPIRGSNFSIREEEDLRWTLSLGEPLVSEQIDVRGLQMPSRHLLSFSQLLGHIQGMEAPSNLKEVNGELHNGFKNRRFFQKGLQWGLGFLLALLLVNFLVFSHYRSKTIAGDGPIDPDQQTELLERIRERVSGKEKKLQALLGSSNTHTTPYLDKIGAGLPESILLDALAYQPLTRPVQPDKPISTDADVLVISGQTNDKEAFAAWTEQLESMDWVKDLEIERYEYLSKTVDNFSLKIYCDAIGQTK
ncbi:hypothetical protein J4E06_07025 [Muricauda sp. NFXS6]|uniref:hypothetical protein n=1 Tax=Allomuricauda sp. NFXS6 TaxID=2819094 RepID=UPI0032DE2CCF